MFIFLCIVFLIALLVLSVLVFMRLPQFGKMPSGKRLDRIKNSPNFREGKFQNQSHTPSLAEGVSMMDAMRDFFFNKSKRNTPADPLPSHKTNLLQLAPDAEVLVWFGHSSYFIQIGGKKILVDPVLSGNASPVTFTTKSFKGSDIYTVDDLPEIDYLLLTHDHWDHLDHETILKLKPKVKKVITGLGNAEHLEYWGYDKSLLIEQDWYDEVILDNGFMLNIMPARHFSGRGFSRNKVLWVSFVLHASGKKIYLGGDSGYDKHFKEIGAQFGPFDLAILECGQYNEGWRYIHMMPEEVVQATLDLGAKALMPVHWAKFSLSLHAWDEPIQRVAKAAEKAHLPLVHPLIGEAVDLNKQKLWTAWWEQLN